MLEILALIGKIMWDWCQFWMGVEIGGFRPFWFLVGCSLLGVFGTYWRGNSEGGWLGKLASKNDLKEKVRIVVEKRRSKKK